MTWRDYWNQDTPIYVSERHKILHYARIASDIAVLVPSPGAIVLDHGCGEALAADRVAARCSRLILCDGAPLVRARLQERFGGHPKIAIVEPEQVDEIEPSSLDLVVANSLAQYLSLDELCRLFALWRDKLKADGRLVLADVIPPAISPAADAKALLSFGWAGGFLTDAVLGLARTAVSDYRKVRDELGFARYEEAEMIDLLSGAGFDAERRRPNLGHNQARMTFVARPRA